MSSDIDHVGPNVLVPPAPLPEVRLEGAEVSVRVAVAGDIEFIDGLQKMHTHMVGWFPKKTDRGEHRK